MSAQIDARGLSAFALYGDTIRALARAAEARDESALSAGLETLAQLRERAAEQMLDRVTGELRRALEDFACSSRLADLATREVPSARKSLDHVLALTDEAAHRTLDLVERSVPLASVLDRDAGQLGSRWEEFRGQTMLPGQAAAVADQFSAFLESTRRNAQQLKANLGEVLMTQGYQDLTGQILRGVIALVDELEAILGGLVTPGAPAAARAAAAAPIESTPSRGYGPVVPGVDHGACVENQGGVDSLLGELGI